MKIKVLLATTDVEYSNYLSKVLSEKYFDVFDISVITDKQFLMGNKHKGNYNIAIVSQDMFDYIDFDEIDLRILFVDETGQLDNKFSDEKMIKKYQRISSIKKILIEEFSEISDKIITSKKGVAKVATFWSPIGGSGKTTLCLAYASKKTLENNKVLYLNLENFASTATYFVKNNTSISSIFENLDNNVEMFIESNMQKDSSTEINYFEAPRNYDDINVLNDEHIEKLISSCANFVDIVVVDLSSQCDSKTRKIFECSDEIYIVNDSSIQNDERIDMFVKQNNVVAKNKHKIKHVNNKVTSKQTAMNDNVINIPYVQAQNPVLVYKTLSASPMY